MNAAGVRGLSSSSTGRGPASGSSNGGHGGSSTSSGSGGGGGVSNGTSGAGGAFSSSSFGTSGSSTSGSSTSGSSSSSGSSSGSSGSSSSSGDGSPQRPIVLHIRQQGTVAGLGSAGGELMRRAGAALLVGASQAAARLNELTGYNVIERLKAKVDEADDGLAAARQELRAAKEQYEQRQAQHGDVQRQLMSLLQRKGSWAAADVERFAGLCREEHGLEGGVAAAKAAYGASAETLEGAHAALLRAIRERYAAETLWSDKIRRASTWWTAGLMALHLASFMSVYLVMEPIKAARLRDHVTGVLRAELSGLRSSVGQLQSTLESHVADFEEVEASARAAAGVAVAAAGTAVAGAAAAGLPVAASGSGRSTATQPQSAEAPAPAASALGPEMQALRQRLEGVEKRVGEVVGALTAHTAALQSQVQAATGRREGVPGPGADLQARHGAGSGSSSSSSSSGSSALAASEVGLEDVAAVDLEAAGKGAQAALRRWGRLGLRWGRALAAALRRAADTPEVATGAAAFAGAALGVGLALALLGATGSAGSGGAASR
ncbi:hypothetical protein HXX76_000137 [Chlamydomonas incerta]|uniref:Sensitive to high expression protein 9, mitochondrial n=1 Tax=Chlamydomonas incerta TaxID=51695 RepID=A0A836B2D3_CHLIN|nr:hypothetical protein HXX76_000137 [Chlamydomonas incerta]|eukprot:KAG2445522.1 hypothetical protein HXX76_000137 [Chlamydomonas incerta]